MELKAQWLNNRKQQIIAELTDCQLQSKDIINNLLSENSGKQKQILMLRQAKREVQNSCKEEISKYLIQIKTLEALLINKEDIVQNLKNQNTQISNLNEERGEIIQQKYAKIIQLQHLLSIEKQQNQKVKNYYSNQLQLKQSTYFEELSKLKKQFDDQINDRQTKLNISHQQQLNQMKRNNMQLLQKIQNQYQSMSSKTSQNSKQAQIDCARLISENSKLMATVNDLKLKMLTLQSSLNSQSQQTKLLQKQIQIVKQNNKRENTFLKQQKITLSEKNKKLTEKIEQLSWSNRQNQLRKQQDIKRIHKEVDKSFQQIIAKAAEENKRSEELNYNMRKELEQKSRQLSQMEQISLRIKEMFEVQEKQMAQLKQQKESLVRQNKAISQSNPLKINEELKSEVVRKNCEIEVLQDEIKRLKIKINTAATAQQDFIKHKDVIEKENKMLLSEIIFLRDKQKKGRNKLQDSKVSKSHFLNDMNSEQSRDYEDVEEYKKIIGEMTEEINICIAKMNEKDNKIEKLEALVKRYERQLKNNR